MKLETIEALDRYINAVRMALRDLGIDRMSINPAVKKEFNEASDGLSHALGEEKLD